MPLLPGAEFWRIWGCALAFVAAAIAGLAAIQAAHGASMRTSFYGAESGKLTASGQRFRPMGFTAAHRSWPFGTKLRVCYARCAIVTVTDRGPAASTGRALDLSHGAARAIGLERAGVGQVDVTRAGATRAGVTRLD